MFRCLLKNLEEDSGLWIRSIRMLIPNLYQQDSVA